MQGRVKQVICGGDSGVSSTCWGRSREQSTSSQCRHQHLLLVTQGSQQKATQVTQVRLFSIRKHKGRWLQKEIEKTLSQMQCHAVPSRKIICLLAHAAKPIKHQLLRSKSACLIQRLLGPDWRKGQRLPVTTAESNQSLALTARHSQVRSHCTAKGDISFLSPHSLLAPLCHPWSYGGEAKGAGNKKSHG